MTYTHEGGLQIRYVPLGHFSLTVTVTAAGLPSIPDTSRLRRTILRNLDNPVRWRDDGTNPTATTGMKALKDEILVYDGQDVSNIRFIRDTLASADVTLLIAYYGT